MEFLNPKKIISQVAISEGSNIADFGFGGGEFLKFLSEEIGKDGIVYAIDIQPDVVRKVSQQFKDENISNTRFLIADLEREGSSEISDGSIDFVLISSILFQADKKENILKEALRILKTQGRLLFIDWKESFGGIGPHKELVFQESDAIEMFKTFSLEFERKVSSGDYHYGLLYRKK